MTTEPEFDAAADSLAVWRLCIASQREGVINARVLMIACVMQACDTFGERCEPDQVLRAAERMFAMIKNAGVITPAKDAAATTGEPPPARGTAEQPADGSPTPPPTAPSAGDAPRKLQRSLSDAMLDEARRRLEDRPDGSRGETFVDVATSMGVTEQCLRNRAEQHGWKISKGKRHARPKAVGVSAAKARPMQLTRKDCVELLKDRGIKFKYEFSEALPGGHSWTIEGIAGHEEPKGFAALHEFCLGLLEQQKAAA